MSNGDQTFRLARLALHKTTSPDFLGYWQQHMSTKGDSTGAR